MNVFISRPTSLPKSFEAAYDEFHQFLQQDGIVPRRLGSTDYPFESPLQGVIDLMEQCGGAIILGYPQIEMYQHVRRNTKITIEPAMMFPTPWNQIEGALAFGIKLPVLVVAHPEVQGGIFDYGVTGKYVLSLDLSKRRWHETGSFQQLYSQWKQFLQKPV